jgi:hypothetical protein
MLLRYPTKTELVLEAIVGWFFASIIVAWGVLLVLCVLRAMHS